MMLVRTTLTIDDEVLEAAREIAQVRQQSVGQVISQLARQGLRPSSRIGFRDNGAPVFAVSPDARPLTEEDVARALWDE